MSNYITKAEVHAEADKLDAGGKKPSPDNVRAIIKRGSNSTIAKHLKTWVPQDQRLELPPIPESLTNAVQALTSDLWHISRAAASEEFHVQLDKAAQETAEARSVAVDAGATVDQLRVEMKAAKAATAKAEKLFKERDTQFEELRAYVLRLETEVAQKNAQVETLERALKAFAPTQKAKIKEPV